jgi:integrase
MINNYCYDNDIDFNIIIPSIKKQANKLPDILSPAEIKLMISAVTSPYDLAIRCIFNMGAGLRISEIIKFSWDHIRWIDWLSNQENYGVAIIKSGKGSKDRIVNIPKNLMKDLYAYAKEQDVLDEFRIPHGNAIFKFGSNTYSENRANKMNKVLAYDKELGKFKTLKSRYNWFRYNILGKECEKALHKHIKIHSLRHSKATYLYEVEKVPIEKIQILLGHSSINTTMLYTKINPKSVFDMLKDTNEI